MVIISTLMVMLECFEYVNEGLSFYLFTTKNVVGSVQMLRTAGSASCISRRQVSLP